MKVASNAVRKEEARLEKPPVANKRFLIAGQELCSQIHPKNVHWVVSFTAVYVTHCQTYWHTRMRKLLTILSPKT